MNDIDVATRYLRKQADAMRRGIKFSLSFIAFKNLMRAKRCKYTGIIMTTPKSGGNPIDTDRSIDRIDNSKGYESGNVVAVCHGINRWKGSFENPLNFINEEIAHKAIHNMIKIRNKNQEK